MRCHVDLRPPPSSGLHPEPSAPIHHVYYLCLYLSHEVLYQMELFSLRRPSYRAARRNACAPTPSFEIVVAGSGTTEPERLIHLFWARECEPTHIPRTNRWHRDSIKHSVIIDEELFYLKIESHQYLSIPLTRLWGPYVGLMLLYDVRDEVFF